MPTLTLSPAQQQFASAVRSSLLQPGQRELPSEYFYDALGSALFEAITLLPEYGLTRADERLVRALAPEVAALVPQPLVAELGSGTGSKTRFLLAAFPQIVSYRPIDVSPAALAHCAQELQSVADVQPVQDTYLAGLAQVTKSRSPKQTLLLLFLGSTIGNFSETAAAQFLTAVRRLLQPGDALLLGADLVKDPHVLHLAYDDPTGVTRAFNLNLLARLNRELGANFHLPAYEHVVRYDAAAQRVESYLRARTAQQVDIPAADLRFTLAAGETIWTERSHKYQLADLQHLADRCGYEPIGQWIDREWPFAENLWRVP